MTGGWNVETDWTTLKQYARQPHDTGHRPPTTVKHITIRNKHPQATMNIFLGNENGAEPIDLSVPPETGTAISLSGLQADNLQALLAKGKIPDYVEIAGL